MIVGLKEKLGFWPPDLIKTWESKNNWIWFHAVSVGEINAVIPLILKIKEEKQNYPIMLSTTTKAGYELAQRISKEKGFLAFFFPFDFPHIVKKLLDHAKIKLFIIVETEIWPNLLCECKKRGIPTLLVNGRLSDKSFRNYHFLRFYFNKVVNLFTEVLSQSETDTNKFKAIGLDYKKIKTLGNLKFVISSDIKLLTRTPTDNNEMKIIFASTHRGEDEIAIETYKALKLESKNIKLVIAPRHVDRTDEIKELVRKESLIPILRTEDKDWKNTDEVLILNTIGELQDFYKDCQITVLCGTFAKIGGHNILEPIRANSYTIIGPNDFKIKALSMPFKERDALVQVKDKEELLEKLKEAITNKSLREKKIENGIRLIQENQNVLNDTKDRLLSYL